MIATIGLLAIVNSLVGLLALHLNQNFVAIEDFVDSWHKVVDKRQVDRSEDIFGLVSLVDHLVIVLLAWLDAFEHDLEPDMVIDHDP